MVKETVQISDKSEDQQPQKRSRWASLFARDEKKPATIPDSHRVYAVGDVHGRLDLLQEIMGNH